MVLDRLAAAEHQRDVRAASAARMFTLFLQFTVAHGIIGG